MSVGAGLAVAGGLGLVGSILGDNTEEDAISSQQAMANNNLAFQNQVYNNEYNFEQPMRQYLTEQFNNPDGSLYFDANKGATEQQYQQAQLQGDEQLAMSGRSDLEGVNNANSLLSEAGNLSQQFQQGKITQANLAASLTNHGQVQAAANGVNQAAGIGVNAMGQEAGLGFQQASALGNAMGGLGTGALQAWQLANPNVTNPMAASYTGQIPQNSVAMGGITGEGTMGFTQDNSDALDNWGSGVIDA
jgi:hypothetical protein